MATSRRITIHIDHDDDDTIVDIVELLQNLLGYMGDSVEVYQESV